MGCSPCVKSVSQPVAKPDRCKATEENAGRREDGLYILVCMPCLSSVPIDLPDGALSPRTKVALGNKQKWYHRYPLTRTSLRLILVLDQRREWHWLSWTCFVIPGVHESFKPDASITLPAKGNSIASTPQAEMSPPNLTGLRCVAPCLFAFCYSP